MKTLDEYQQAVRRTAAGSQDGKIPRAAVFALGLTGEAGEVADLLKKVWGHGKDLDLSALTKELGDVLWYLTALADAFNLDLATVARVNINKLKARYPDGFTHAAANARIDERPLVEKTVMATVPLVGHDGSGAPVSGCGECGFTACRCTE